MSTLILGCCVGESICIGNDIKITIIHHESSNGRSRGKFRIQIDAPRDLPILRSELLGTPPKATSNASSKLQPRVIPINGLPTIVTKIEESIDV